MNAPTKVMNNNLSCSTSVYFSLDAPCVGNGDGDADPYTCSLAEMEALVDITDGASGNVSLDPMFVDSDGADNDATTLNDNDWHLTTLSPANVFEGGLDLSAHFTTDKDAKSRTAVVSNAPNNVGAAGWSIGAFEFDQ